MAKARQGGGAVHARSEIRRHVPTHALACMEDRRANTITRPSGDHHTRGRQATIRDRARGNVGRKSGGLITTIIITTHARVTRVRGAAAGERSDGAAIEFLARSTVVDAGCAARDGGAGEHFTQHSLD